MNRGAKVELYEKIRREYDFGVGTIRGVAQKLGVHRRLVREAILSAAPPPRKVGVRPAPALDPVKPFIDLVLEADKTAPRKQRHTAHRIWVRLCQEKAEHPVAESSVRAYVRIRKAAMGLAAQETHIPQDYQFGVEAQVDWYEAAIDLGDERVTLQMFCMRSMKSGAAFHCAYRHATQQAFLEAHEAAFAYFGGVFQLLRYDNLTSAVKKMYKGHLREEQTRFVEFRSHWRFDSEFCAAAQPQEKGGVEGEVGTFRRNHLVPVPEAADLAALNQKLLAGCVADHSRRIGDRPAPVGTLFAAERTHLLPLAKEGFDLAESHDAVVDGRGCVKTHLAWYSTPLRVGTNAQVRALPSSIEVWHSGSRVAVHERSYVRGQQTYNLEHYLSVLDRKPGALPGARPVAQWRENGRWPQSFDTLLEMWQQRLGKQEGNRAMVDFLLLARKHGWPALYAVAQRAVTLGCTDANAVKCLLNQPASETPVARLSAQDLGGLSRYDRAMPEMSGYDQLLGGVQ